MYSFKKITNIDLPENSNIIRIHTTNLITNKYNI